MSNKTEFYGGFIGDPNLPNGGAYYCSNDVPDVDADDMMNYCTDVSTDFSNIEFGEVVHMNGHIGVYIGDGLAIEATPAWEDKVQITAVGNIGTKEGYHTRTWENHGKLQWILYQKPEPEPEPIPEPEPEPIPEPTSTLIKLELQIGKKLIKLEGEMTDNN